MGGDVQPRTDLIFDVGMHTGQDTDFYLSKGFKVVAIDANPQLCAHAEEKFSEHVKNRRLYIENVCVGNKNSRVKFYVNPKVTEWSSIHERLGNRGLDHPAKCIEVEMVTVDKLFRKYGVPYYLKIDVEGADGLVIQGLWNSPIKPAYVSYEASSLEGLCHLFCQGYRHFKMVNQKSFLDYKLPNPPLEGAYCDYVFQAGSSGPFGEETPGPWSVLEEVVADVIKFRHFERNDRRFPASWIDVHAKNLSSLDRFFV